MTEPTTSMTAKNRYRFVCPTTGRQEFYLKCHVRRYHKWRGDQRKIEGDCATCMTASKCAALAMMDIERRRGRAVFYDENPATLNRLPREVMAAIEAVQIRPFHGQGTTVTPEVLADLVEGRVNGVIIAAPVPAAPPARRGTPKSDLSGIVAGATTNMAEAINAASAISQG